MTAKVMSTEITPRLMTRISSALCTAFEPLPPFFNEMMSTAVKAQSPIVPIAFIDSYRVLDQKGSKPVSMQIHYLKPISYEDYKDLKTVELAALVKGRIQQVIDANT